MTTSAVIAALIGTLVLGFVEALARFYPSKRTWMRLRSRNGRRAVWAMRERLAELAEHRLIRILAILLFGLVLGWIASASLLDKRWYEVVYDVTPYALVGAAMLRTPSALRRIAARMKSYEDEMGDDPERDIHGPGDGGPSAMAL